MRTFTRGLPIVALTTALLVSGCAGSDTADPTDTADGDTSSEAPGAATEQSIAVGTLEPGQYATDMLGTELGITLTDEWTVPIANEGAVVFEGADAPVPFTRAVLVLRGVQPSWFSAPPPNTLAGFEPWTFESDVDVQERVLDARVGGENTIGFDLATVATGAVPLMASEGLGGVVELKPGEVVRMWLVEQGETEPIFILAFVTADDVDWLSTADALVDTITLGDVAPSPVLGGPLPGGDGGGTDPSLAEAAGFHNQEDFPPGLLAFDLLGGVEVSSPAPGIVYADLPSGEEDISLLAPTQTAGGTPLPDVESLIAAVEATGERAEPFETFEVMGREVQGYVDLLPSLGEGVSVAPPDGPPDALPVVAPAETQIDIPLDVNDQLVVISARSTEAALDDETALRVMVVMLTSVGIG